MPEYRAPGVYVSESRSGTIEGVATSITAFLGRTSTGPSDVPTRVTSFADFERHYGGLSPDCPLSYAVRQFFDNGGTDAVIVRIVHRNARGQEDATAAITDADIAGPGLELQQRGLWRLDQVDLFNLLCIPPLAPGVDVAPATWDAAVGYAKRRRAFVIVDAPAHWHSAGAAVAGVGAVVTRDSHAALYFPRIVALDPLAANAPRPFAPCGAIAGLFARTDRNRGVWKAPAGLEADLPGITGIAVPIGAADSGTLNVQAVNALRSEAGRGILVWGARTLVGTDALSSEWKYISVRRTALFIAESLDRGLKWVVFEPSAEPLWARIRSDVDGFMQTLFQRGAFLGQSAREAYLVKCDAGTNSANDISRGIVNLVVGFAPIKPAEFVVLRMQLSAVPATP